MDSDHHSDYSASRVEDLEGDENDDHEIEIAISLDTDRSSINSGRISKGVKKIAREWAVTTMIMSYTASLGLLSTDPKNLIRQHPIPFGFFLIVVMAAFYFPIIGYIFSEEKPNIGKACNIIALVAFILSFALLLWTILPPPFNLLSWGFCVFTSLALICITLRKNLKEQHRSQK